MGGRVIKDGNGTEHQFQWELLRALLQPKHLDIPRETSCRRKPSLCSGPTPTAGITQSRQRESTPVNSASEVAHQATQTANPGEEAEKALLVCQWLLTMPKAAIPVLFDAIGERISPTTVFSFGHSVLSTAHGHFVLFKGVCCHSFQARQGPLGLGTCGRTGSWWTYWTRVQASLTTDISLKAPGWETQALPFHNPSVNTSSGIFQRTCSHSNSEGFMWQMHTYIKLQLNWFYILRGSLPSQGILTIVYPQKFNFKNSCIMEDLRGYT